MNEKAKKLQKLVIWITVILVLGIVGATVYIGFDLDEKLGISKPKTAEENSILSTAMVQSGNIEKSISGIGNIEATYTQAIVMPSSGRVQEVMVVEGQKVKTGVALVKLDTELLQESLDALQTELEDITQQISSTGVTTQRINIRAPISGTIINEHVSWNADVDEVIAQHGALLTIEGETQTVEIGVNVPSGTIKSTDADNGEEFDVGDILFKVDIQSTAFADLDELMNEIREDITIVESLLEDPYIKALEDGIVYGNTYIEGADFLEDGILFYLYLLQDYAFTIMVDEIDLLESVYIGQSALITFENGIEYTAKVSFINYIAASNDGDYQVKLTIDDGQDLSSILIGQTADAAILVESVQGVLKVPIEAVYEDSEGQYVMVYTGAGDISNYADMDVPMEKRYIESGIVSELYVEVVSGVQEGDMLIIAMGANERANEGKGEGKGKSGVYGLVK